MRLTNAISLTYAVALLAACGESGDSGTDSGGSAECTVPPSDPTEGNIVDVSGAFAPCDALVDAATGESYTVSEGGLVAVEPGAEGVVLLERDGSTEPAFDWDNASVYFLMTDRFENGDPTNDSNYGRTLAAASPDVGAWHGGDFAGITQRLDYIADLGMDAIWISPPVEQIHGWVGGGSMGDFQHFAYHGYWALDFTKLDANFGTEEELRTLVREAHARGIRVLFDVVLNHPGYASIADLETFLPEVLGANYERWAADNPEPGAGESWHSFNNQIQFGGNVNWINWWGPDFIRVEDFPGHEEPGTDPLTSQLASLPDFRTESTEPADFPPLLTRKTDTAATPIEGATVRDYLVAWHTDWVRRFGIDGFRVDTAKHVELGTWTALKDAGTQALQEWRANNPNDPLTGDTEFWMTGEAFPPVNMRDAYFPAGFDSLINFDFGRNSEDIVSDFDEMETFYADLDALVNSDPNRNELTYASSHDTELFFAEVGEDMDLQTRLGSVLMMMPGAVQVFYGDESARPAGPPSSDGENPTRSDMNWDQHTEADRAALIAHWQRLGQFRQRHRAIGKGDHQVISNTGGMYAFQRTLNDGEVDDAVVVVMFTGDQ